VLSVVEKVLAEEEVRDFRQRMEAATWEDGASSAGTLARGVKRNQQLPEGVEPAASLGQHILRRLGQKPAFISAALPARIYPPRFNRYTAGANYGLHVDSAVMSPPGSQQPLRSDLSATLFLSGPDEYDGGELTIEHAHGTQAVKLEAGDLVLYPSSSLHRVSPVTRGARIAAFFWIQSLVPDDAARSLLFDLDRAIQGVTPSLAPDDPHLLALTGIYHNLLRRWAVT
jgi:PKHD-type hydroxylase